MRAAHKSSILLFHLRSRAAVRELSILLAMPCCALLFFFSLFLFASPLIISSGNCVCARVHNSTVNVCSSCVICAGYDGSSCEGADGDSGGGGLGDAAKCYSLESFTIFVVVVFQLFLDVDDTGPGWQRGSKGCSQRCVFWCF